MVNRTQALVLGFFVVALGSLVVILVAAPEVYDQALRLPDSSGVAEVAFLAVLAPFLAGILRVPVAILQLTGVLAADVPTWYVLFQGLIGLAQVAIGLAMLAGYRRSGVWGSF